MPLSVMIISFLVFLVYFCGRDTDLRSVQESEELLVNVAATINNLSFYQAESSVLRHSELTITKCKTARLTDINVGIKNKIDELFVLFCSISFPLPCSLFLCTPVMLKLVLSSSMDAMLEATRAYGNLSQSKDVRDFIMENKGK